MLTIDCPVCIRLKLLNELKASPSSETRLKLLKLVNRVCIGEKEYIIPLPDVTEVKRIGCQAHANWNWESFQEFVFEFNSPKIRLLLYGEESGVIN